MSETKILNICIFLSMLYLCAGTLCDSPGSPDQYGTPCANRRYMCRNDTVWATDGRQCYVFKDGCQLAKENCDRETNGYTPMTPIYEGICKRRCPINVCTLEFNPLCAALGEQEVIFPNPCFYNAGLCSDTYIFKHMGPCKNATQPAA